MQSTPRTTKQSKPYSDGACCALQVGFQVARVNSGKGTNPFVGIPLPKLCEAAFVLSFPIHSRIRPKCPAAIKIWVCNQRVPVQSIAVKIPYLRFDLLTVCN